jgi:hypothetical protein
MRATCPAHLILLDLISLMKFPLLKNKKLDMQHKQEL